MACPHSPRHRARSLALPPASAQAALVWLATSGAGAGVAGVGGASSRENSWRSFSAT